MASSPDRAKALEMAREALEDAKNATPGPWRVEAEYGEDIGVICTRYEDETPGVCASYSKDWPLEVADAELIANARNREPILARALLASEAEVERLRALKHEDGPYFKVPDGAVEVSIYVDGALYLHIEAQQRQPDPGVPVFGAPTP